MEAQGTSSADTEQSSAPAAEEVVVSASPSSGTSTTESSDAPVVQVLVPVPTTPASAATHSAPSPAASNTAVAAMHLPSTPSASASTKADTATPALTSSPGSAMEPEKSGAANNSTTCHDAKGTEAGDAFGGSSEPTDMEIDALINIDDIPKQDISPPVSASASVTSFDTKKEATPPTKRKKLVVSRKGQGVGVPAFNEASDTLGTGSSASPSPSPSSSPTMEARPPTPPPRPPTPPLTSPNRPVPKDDVQLLHQGKKSIHHHQAAAGADSDEEDEMPLQLLKKKRDEEEQQKSATESAFAAAQAEAEALRRRVQELEEKLKNNQREQEEAEWDGSGDVKGDTRGSAGTTSSNTNDDDESKRRRRAASQPQGAKSKRRKVTAEIKKDYQPGFVDIDEAYYCTLDDETCFEVADKLGVKWKELALANKRRYGTIREWDRFQEYTTLMIPDSAKKENIQSLRMEPSSSDEDDGEADESTPKLPSMIASDAAPSRDDSGGGRSAQKLAQTIENKSQHFTITAADNEEGGPFVPARLPSNDAARDPAHEMWAHRLLGKEVEVYWEEEDNKDSDNENDYSDSDDEGDPTDWYEAKIVSYNPEDGMFGVEFVGDETSIYRMELNKNIVRPSGRRLEDPRTVVEDRMKYLHSLARRKSIAKYANEFEEGDELNLALEEDTLFRGDLRLRAQSMLRKSLLKGMKFMGIDPSTDADAEAFCAMKSWELEQALYAEFGRSGDKTARRISGEYKKRVRILKSNLEDIKNPTLAPRVLTGNLSIADLIQLSPEELASRATKMKRIKAEEEAKKDIVLTPGIGTSPAKEKRVIGKTINTKEISAPPLSSSTAVAPSAPKPASATSVHIKALLKNKVGMAATVAAPPPQHPQAPQGPSMGMSGMAMSGMGSMAMGMPTQLSPISQRTGMHVNAYQQAHAPVPPFAAGSAPHPSQPYGQQYYGAPFASGPSRGYAKVAPVSFAAANGGQIEYEGSPGVGSSGQAAAAPAPAQPPLPSGRTGRVLNKTGGMRFQFKISSLVRCSFETSFVLEREGGQPRLAIDRYLPEKIPQETGRLSFSEFDKFVGGKLARGSAMMAVLRMVDVHDDDELNFKLFYRKYEEAGRIPMFKMEKEDAKLFLVTPKFMRARCLQGKVSNQRQAHAVVLMQPGALREL